MTSPPDAPNRYVCAPDLVIADIRMPPTHTEEGPEAARAIREEFPHIVILLLAAHIEVEHATELLASGDRVGYLLKNRVTDVEEFARRWIGSPVAP